MAGFFGGPVAGLLSTGDDFADPGAEAIEAVGALEAASGVDAYPQILALVRPAAGDVRSAAGRRVVRRVQGRIDGVPGVARTVSALDGGDRSSSPATDAPRSSPCSPSHRRTRRRWARTSRRRSPASPT